MTLMNFAFTCLSTLFLPKAVRMMTWVRSKRPAVYGVWAQCGRPGGPEDDVPFFYNEDVTTHGGVPSTVHQRIIGWQSSMQNVA